MNRLEQHKFPPARFGLNDCSFTQKNLSISVAFSPDLWKQARHSSRTRLLS